MGIIFDMKNRNHTGNHLVGAGRGRLLHFIIFQRMPIVCVTETSDGTSIAEIFIQEVLEASPQKRSLEAETHAPLCSCVEKK